MSRMFESAILVDYVINPVEKVCDFGIDTWVALAATANVPGHYAYQIPLVSSGTHQWSP